MSLSAKCHSSLIVSPVYKGTGLIKGMPFKLKYVRASIQCVSNSSFARQCCAVPGPIKAEVGKRAIWRASCIRLTRTDSLCVLHHTKSRFGIVFRTFALAVLPFTQKSFALQKIMHEPSMGSSPGNFAAMSLHNMVHPSPG